MLMLASKENRPIALMLIRSVNTRSKRKRADAVAFLRGNGLMDAIVAGRRCAGRGTEATDSSRPFEDLGAAQRSMSRPSRIVAPRRSSGTREKARVVAGIEWRADRIACRSVGAHATRCRLRAIIAAIVAALRAPAGRIILPPTLLSIFFLRFTLFPLRARVAIAGYLLAGYSALAAAGISGASCAALYSRGE